MNTSLKAWLIEINPSTHIKEGRNEMINMFVHLTAARQTMLIWIVSSLLNTALLYFSQIATLISAEFSCPSVHIFIFCNAVHTINKNLKPNSNSPSSMNNMRVNNDSTIIFHISSLLHMLDASAAPLQAITAAFWGPPASWFISTENGGGGSSQVKCSHRSVVPVHHYSRKKNSPKE